MNTDSDSDDYIRACGGKSSNGAKRNVNLTFKNVSSSVNISAQVR